MHGELIVKELVELAVNAAVVIRASSEFDAALHGVQAGLFPRG
jgi:hypothetical protein